MLAVYALIADPPSAPLGLGATGEALEVLSFGSVSAVAGKTPATPSFAADRAIAFDAVVKAIDARVPAILPVRFGTTFPDAAALGRALDERKVELDAALALVRGKVQMTIRLSGRAEPQPPAVTAREDSQRSGGPGTKYLAKKFSEYRRTQTVPELEPLRTRVASLIAAERTERHDAPPWFASAHHLVARDRVSEYERAAREALPELAVKEITAAVSGPWPPYAFAAGAFT